MIPKILFTDLDGTAYYNKDNIVLDSTMDAIRQLKDQGCKIFICTSRSYHEAKTLPKDFYDLVDGVIANTGSVILENDQIIVKHLIDNDDLKIIIDFILKNKAIFRYIQSDNKGYLNSTSDDINNLFYDFYKYIPPIKLYENQELISTLFYGISALAQSEIVPKLKNTTILDLGFVSEVFHKDVNKGTGIIDVCNYYNIAPKDTVSFGDGINDIDMFKVDNVKICMGNGSDVLKPLATYVTDTIIDDGFYNACKHFGWVK